MRIGLRRNRFLRKPFRHFLRSTLDKQDSEVILCMVFPLGRADGSNLLSEMI